MSLQGSDSLFQPWGHTDGLACTLQDNEKNSKLRNKAKIFVTRNKTRSGKKMEKDERNTIQSIYYDIVTKVVIKIMNTDFRTR